MVTQLEAFFESLVDTLHKGERHAALEFEKVTSY
jgi:hypothetical protein